jgi:hypothetical protein
MVLAIYNCIQVPFSIAFIPEDKAGPIEFAFNQIIDFIFILDVVITFRTTYINEETGVEVIQTKQIAIKYLMGKALSNLLYRSFLDRFTCFLTNRLDLDHFIRRVNFS